MHLSLPLAFKLSKLFGKPVEEILFPNPVTRPISGFKVMSEVERGVPDALRIIHHGDKNSKGLGFVSFMPLWLRIDLAERVGDASRSTNKQRPVGNKAFL